MDRFKLVPESHLFLLRDERILLLRRCNTDYEDGKYSVVAGHMEDGETARESICREAHEEVGIELAPDDLEFAHVVHRADRGQRIGFFFRALRWRGEPCNLEPHKADDLRWFPLDALPENMVPYVHRAIEQWRAGQGYSESGWAERQQASTNRPNDPAPAGASQRQGSRRSDRGRATRPA